MNTVHPENSVATNSQSEGSLYGKLAFTLQISGCYFQVDFLTKVIEYNVHKLHTLISVACKGHSQKSVSKLAITIVQITMIHVYAIII